MRVDESFFSCKYSSEGWMYKEGGERREGSRPNPDRGFGRLTSALLKQRVSME